MESIFYYFIILHTKNVKYRFVCRFVCVCLNKESNHRTDSKINYRFRIRLTRGSEYCKTGIFCGHVIFAVFAVGIQSAKINDRDLDRVAKKAEKSEKSETTHICSHR